MAVGEDDLRRVRALDLVSWTGFLFEDLDVVVAFEGAGFPDETGRLEGCVGATWPFGAAVLFFVAGLPCA